MDDEWQTVRTVGVNQVKSLFSRVVCVNQVKSKPIFVQVSASSFFCLLRNSGFPQTDVLFAGGTMKCQLPGI